MMNSEGITSLAVVDNQFNVVGNISNTDVKVGSNLSSAYPMFPADIPDLS